ncbi:Signal peptidase complex catalytic subunit [Polyrhizophydium stewartii]|uniref:Signal peptidase complex catalytic subunit SEC11 n=1 Tax=Polyrhizophydium stewartii TaxID=2732419 RepID=A0ABR4NBH8_9FUNG
MLQVLTFLLFVASALFTWRGLGLLLNLDTPVVVVISESMEPAFQRGDLLVLSMWSRPISVGDICVYKRRSDPSGIPIVHRIVHTHKGPNGKRMMLTKGDNNPGNDRGLYDAGQQWLEEDDIVGRVAGHLPYVGMFTILLNDYPVLKFVMLGLVGLSVLVTPSES